MGALVAAATAIAQDCLGVRRKVPLLRGPSRRRQVSGWVAFAVVVVSTMFIGLPPPTSHPAAARIQPQTSPPPHVTRPRATPSPTPAPSPTDTPSPSATPTPEPTATPAPTRIPRSLQSRARGPSPVVLTGLGATQANWDTTHTPDPDMAPGTAFLPRLPGGGDRYAGVSYTTAGRVWVYQMNYVPGEPISLTQADVQRDLPPDTPVPSDPEGLVRVGFRVREPRPRNGLWSG